jgi:hypothetical protein
LLLKRSDLASGFVVLMSSSNSFPSTVGESTGIAGCHTAAKNRRANAGVAFIHTPTHTTIISAADVYAGASIAATQAAADEASFRCMTHNAPGFTLRREVNGVKEELTYTHATRPRFPKLAANSSSALHLTATATQNGQKYAVEQDWIFLRYGRALLLLLVNSAGVSHAALTDLVVGLDRHARAARP